MSKEINETFEKLVEDVKQHFKELSGLDEGVATRQHVKRYMISVAKNHLDNGRLNFTSLAEAAAHQFNHDEWLDDETHWVWDLAVDVGDKLGISEETLTEAKGGITLHAYVYTEYSDSIVVFVDTENVHPDPSKQLIWGYDESGVNVSGDFKRKFEKIGKPIKIPFTPKSMPSHGQEKSARLNALRGWIQKNGKSHAAKLMDKHN